MLAGAIAFAQQPDVRDLLAKRLKPAQGRFC
jgi:hypothetical protein